MDCKNFHPGTGTPERPDPLISDSVQGPDGTSIQDHVYLRAMIENCTDGIVSIDERGTIQKVNGAMVRIFGHEREALIGRNISMLMPSPTHEEHDMYLRRHLETGRTRIIGSRREVTGLHRDGTTFPIELGVSEVLLGKSRFYTGILRDITARKLDEIRLGRLATAMEQAAESVVITDLHGIMLDVNPAFVRITGYSREEAIGTRSNLVKSGLQDAQFYTHLWSTLGAGEVWHGQFTNRKKDGTLYQEEATISPVRDGQGVVTNFVAIKRDVTAERDLERQLRQAQKLESIGRLAAGIAHEINTPIQYIGDNTQFLRDAFSDLQGLLTTLQAVIGTEEDDKDPAAPLAGIRQALEKADLESLLEEIPKALNESLEGLERVAGIVRSMKEFAHPSQEKAPFDINHAIQSTLTVARNEWKYVAQLETDLDPQMPSVPGIPGEFNQVILNMIVNAAHAIGAAAGENQTAQGRITIRTRRADPWAEIFISDTGTGMSAETQSHIFDPFFTTKEIGKGSGQGLTLAHSVIVNGHGGTLEVDSELGRGTTFIIRLPLQEAANATEEPEGAHPAEPGAADAGVQHRI